MSGRQVLLALATAALSVGLLIGCGGAQARFSAHMKRGQAYLAQGDLQRANVEFRNAIQIAPRNSSARLSAADVAERLGRPRDAFGLYQSVVEAEPDNIDARARLGRLLALSGMTQEALKAIEPALATHPDDARLLLVRAAVRIQQKDSAGAVADADRALQLSPDDAEAVEVRAGLYKQAGEVAAAIQLVNQAVAKSPRTVALREMLADLYSSAGDPAQAEEQQRALVSLQPQEERFRYALASFYVRERKIDAAQRVLEEAVKAMPDKADIKLTLADFLATRRSRLEGERALRAFIAQSPDDYDLRLGLGALLQRTGASDAAVQAYREVVERDGTRPHGLTARDRLAALAVARQDYSEANRLLGQVLQKNPQDNDALVLRGQIESAQNDPAAAISDFRAVLRDQPQLLDVRRSLARAYVQNGAPRLAEETLRAALELFPASAAVRVDLAQLLLQERRADDAVPLLEQAARNAPRDLLSRQELVRAHLQRKDFPAARAVSDEVGKLWPDSAPAAYLAAQVAQAQQQPDEARKQLQRALQLDPKAFDVLAALAALESSSGHGDRAVQVVKSASEREPENAAVSNLLGQVYLAAKDLPNAAATFERAIALAPKWWVPYRNLALARYAAGDTEGTVQAYEGGIQAAPANAQLVSELASLYETNGRADAAIATYEALYRLTPKAEFVANNLAMLLVTHKSDRASLDRARDLTAPFADSTDGSLLDTNGWVHFKRAEYAQALTVLQRAAERRPDSREIRGHLGLVELRQGETARAQKDLETAMAGSSGDFAGAKEVRAALAALKTKTG